MASDNILWAYGVIDPDDISALSVRDQLREFDKRRPVLLRVNSPGGSVTEAIAIHTQLREWKAGVDVVIDGLAASAASYLACVGGKVAIARDAMLMLHNCWSVSVGDHRELRKTADVLETITQQITRAYARKSGRSTEEVRRWLDDETWFTASGAVEAGLADFIVGDDGQPISASRRTLAEMQRQLDEARALISGAGRGEPTRIAACARPLL